MSIEVSSRCLTCNIDSKDDCVYETLGTAVLEDLITHGAAVSEIQHGGEKSGLLKVGADYSGSIDFSFYGDHAGHRIDVIDEYGKLVSSYEKCKAVNE